MGVATDLLREQRQLTETGAAILVALGCDHEGVSAQPMRRWLTPPAISIS